MREGTRLQIVPNESRALKYVPERSIFSHHLGLWHQSATRELDTVSVTALITALTVMQVLRSYPCLCPRAQHTHRSSRRKAGGALSPVQRKLVERKAHLLLYPRLTCAFSQSGTPGDMAVYSPRTSDLEQHSLQDG